MRTGKPENGRSASVAGSLSSAQRTRGPRPSCNQGTCQSSMVEYTTHQGSGPTTLDGLAAP